MSAIKKKAPIIKDKVLGEVKEAVGKASGNETLELKGKLQSLKADIKEKLDIEDRAEELKEGIAGIINDGIDKIKGKNDDVHTRKSQK